MRSAYPARVAMPAASRMPPHVIDELPCEEDPELFFPPGTSWQGHADQAAEAKAQCRRCPVAAACLRWALDTIEPYAIAGGTTPRERRKMLGLPVADMDGEACGTRNGYEQHRRRGEKACTACLTATAAYNAARRELQKQRQAAAS